MGVDVPFLLGLGAQNRKAKSGIKVREAVFCEKRPTRVELPGEPRACLYSYGCVGVGVTANGDLGGVYGAV